MASIILVIIQIGIKLGIEFVEKEEIRQMKKEIDAELNKEWMAKLEDFLKRRYEEPGTLDQEEITQEIAELGEATRHNQVASTLLKVLSKIVSGIINFVVALIVGAILLVLAVWAFFAFPDYATYISSFVVGMAFFVMICGLGTRKRIRSYLNLRSRFYELSENPSLLKAKEISDELERLEVIYA